MAKPLTPPESLLEAALSQFYYCPMEPQSVVEVLGDPRGKLNLGCRSSKASAPFGRLSKSHSRHVARVMPRGDSLASAAPASPV
jgi:hypothetical protein